MGAAKVTHGRHARQLAPQLVKLGLQGPGHADQRANETK